MIATVAATTSTIITTSTTSFSGASAPVVTKFSVLENAGPYALDDREENQQARAMPMPRSVICSPATSQDRAGRQNSVIWT